MRFENLMGNGVQKGQNSVRFYLTVLGMACMYVLQYLPNDLIHITILLSCISPGGRGTNPGRGRQHSFVGIDHEIFSTVILSLPLIQEGQLSVSGERMCTILVNSLED